MPDSHIEQLLVLLDEACHRRSWHGTNLRGSIRGLDEKQAAWSAARGKRTMADIVVHTAYWKYSVRRRLRREKRGSFALKGSDWFDLPAPLSAADWRGWVRLLTDEHSELRQAVADLPSRRLDETPPGSRTAFRELIRGAALHDVYHAGQIQLIKGLHRKR